MLYEFAITPDVFDADTNQNDPDHRSELHALLRDLAEVGSIADFDKLGWRSEVFKRVNEWPEERYRERELVKRYLNLMKDRHRLVSYPKRKPGPPQVDSHWLDLARDAHKVCPFDWIVYGERTKGPWAAKNPVASPVHDVRHSVRWNPPRSISVKMCEDEYCSLLAPFLRDAKWLQIVDPYVSYRSDELFDIVRVCAELLGNRRHGRQPGTITIHTELNLGEASTPNEVLGKWASKIAWLRSFLDVSHNFIVVIWKQDLSPDDLHDRFLLTDQGGISIPGGLACYKSGTRKKTVWTLLSHEVCQERLQDYNPQLSTHLVLGERSV